MSPTYDARAGGESSRQATEDWNEHWNAFAMMAARNPAQAYRRKLVFEHLALERSQGAVRLLDLGSGTGELAREVLRYRPDASVLGLDCSPSGVALATRTVPNARFIEQDFTRPLTVGDEYRGWATHAVCSEVLEHLEDPVQVLRNVGPLLGDGCRLVITVPAGPMSAFDKHIGHVRHFDTGLLERTLRLGAMNVVELSGAGFPFFNLYRLVVIARGAKLVEDATRPPKGRPPLGALAAMAAFSWLFKLNPRRATTRGWQLVAVATPVR
ncbi:MAG: class I SAM-dependent methyltransferase [Polyangiaceae bacterium]